MLRHGQSWGNLQQRMQGHGEEALSRLGQQQVQRLGQRLLAESWWPSQIYSSPLRRAQQTAEQLRGVFLAAGAGADGSGCPLPPVQYDSALEEFQNGIFQGLTWPEAQIHYPELCQSLEATLDWLPIPGAESLIEGRQRAHGFIQQLLQRHMNCDHIWIITHQWILQHLIAALLECHHSWKIPADFTALFEFSLDRDRWHCSGHNQFNTELWQICRFNDASHLATDLRAAGQ
ncbi:fructose-2,6-bisphosphatase [Neosynechococcus sphagnicola sy1]|uniref:Fructose-2,6-bisphosphatase n=2 Tax=Neosynechococcus TaxID=1501143 RepID=A0A098THD6_9CYAN|nr:fructose-2,6-bisphosphatase [Neosynechococcus sphagnicola sy1]